MSREIDFGQVDLFKTGSDFENNKERMDRRTELMQLTVDELVDLIMEMENERPICDLY